MKDFLFEQNLEFQNEAREQLSKIFPNEPACNIDGAAIIMTELFSRYRMIFFDRVSEDLEKQLRGENNER